MKVYLISQTQHNDYDTYDSFVVVAKNAEQARRLKPLSKDHYGDWAFDYDHIDVQQIGSAKGPARIILGSFNAG